MSKLKITNQELYDIGFKDELTGRPNGVLVYELIEDEDDSVFIQICTENTDIIPCLWVSQYNYSEMQGNIAYLPMVNISTIEELKESITTLKKLFTWQTKNY